MSHKHHAPYIQIIHSFCLLLSFFFVFFVCCKSFSIKKISSPIHDFVLLLQQTTFGAPFSKERSRRHWVSVWCKTACFGWNTLPPLCSGTVQPRDWSGDGICFCFFPLIKFSPLLRCLVGACPVLDVPLHVKSQMVRPGETSVTVTAFKWLCPSVLPEVSGQLVASCKTPRAAFP